jgi:hypothetical protein
LEREAAEGNPMAERRASRSSGEPRKPSDSVERELRIVDGTTA